MAVVKKAVKTCPKCFAVILNNPDDIGNHEDWHKRLSKLVKEAGSPFFGFGVGVEDI